MGVVKGLEHVPRYWDEAVWYLHPQVRDENMHQCQFPAAAIEFARGAAAEHEQEQEENNKKVYMNGWKMGV